MRQSICATAITALLLIALGSSAPSTASQAMLRADVMNVTWEWLSLKTPAEQVKIDAPERYTIRFGPDGRVALRADCNRGNAVYSVGPDRRIALGTIAVTRAACPPGSLSDRFVREIGRVISYLLQDSELFLELPVDSGTLRFRRRT
jgi:heat shock protein HslJ